MAQTVCREQRQTSWDDAAAASEQPGARAASKQPGASAARARAQFWHRASESLGSVALLPQAFHRLGIENEESL